MSRREPSGSARGSENLEQGRDAVPLEVQACPPDLRRWEWWDLTADVLKHFDAPTHAAPVVRRGIVRYALTCPAAEARTFIAAVRKSDPALVAKVEETLKLYEPAGK